MTPERAAALASDRRALPDGFYEDPFPTYHRSGRVAMGRPVARFEHLRAAGKPVRARRAISSLPRRDGLNAQGRVAPGPAPGTEHPASSPTSTVQEAEC